MTSSRFCWLHLTDLHYGMDGQDCLWPTLRRPFLEDLEELRQQTGPWQAVLFTGDLVQRGKSDEFKRLQSEFLDRLWDRLRELDSGDAVLLAVPGNHDLYRPSTSDDNPAVDRLVEVDGFDRVADKFWTQPAGSYRRVINDSLAAYMEWWRTTPKRAALQAEDSVLPGDFACTIEHGGWRIGIIGLNTTFLQLQGGDYQGRLVWSERQLHAVCDGAVDDWLARHHACLLLTHQGPDWLTDQARKQGEIEIAPAGRFVLHLFGHMHENELVYTRKGGSADVVRLCQGCSLFGMETFGHPPQIRRSHGYTAGQIEFTGDGATFRLWPRIATDKPSGWRYVADSLNCKLRPDGGTHSEALSLRSLGAANKDPSKGQQSRPSAGLAPVLGVGAQLPHSTLPSRRPFFGRKQDLEAVARVLHPDHVGWGIVIDGPGGMGKTALAIEAAHLAPAEYYPLKLFVTAKSRYLDVGGEREARDHRVADFLAMLSEIGVALGREDIPRADSRERADEVRHALAGHRVLLVLDNLETFTAAERRRVYDLLESLPRTCRAIVTTRVRDDTAARTLRLARLDREAAGQLLDALGEHASAIARLTPKERETLYVETAGNPLLLTWTAGQLGRAAGRCRTVEESVSRLQTAHQQQRADEKNDPLDFIFGDLARTFSSAETAVLAALAHFSGPARLSWLAPLAELSENAAFAALEDLRNRAVVSEDDAAETWLLPPLAARFLRRSAARAVGIAGERLAQRSYALAVELGYAVKAPFHELEANWPAVEAGLPLLIMGENARLQKACDALERFFDFSGRWDEWIYLSKEAEAKAVAAGDWFNAALRAFDLGTANYLRGDAAAVLVCAGRCAEHGQRAGSQLWEPYSLNLRSLGHSCQGDFAAAIAAAEEALRLAIALMPDAVGITTAVIFRLGDAQRKNGDLDGAEHNFREALRLAVRSGSEDGVASSSSRLADVFLARGEWPAAERQASAAMELAAKIGKREYIGHNEHSLAQALLRQERPGEALAHAKQAVAIYSQLRLGELSAARMTLQECEAAIADGATIGLRSAGR